MKVYHLFHSGILIETDDKQLFFDAVSDISNMIDTKKEVYFFVSHSHQDHFSKSIYNYSNSNVHYILSNDISDTRDNAIILQEDSYYDYKDLKISTFPSTDRGLAFYVELNGYSIFHSGDLNWWHWENDDKSSQKQEELNFKKIISKIPEEIDIAFIPVDPRLKNSYYLSADYLLKTKTIHYLIPIHFNYDFGITKKLKTHLSDESIVIINGKNEMVLEVK